MPREEVLEIEANDDALRYVRRDEGLNGVALQEAVHGGIGRNAFEDARENFALRGFEARLRSLNQPHAACSLGEQTVVIVPQCLGGIQVGEVRKPLGALTALLVFSYFYFFTTDSVICDGYCWE